VMHYKVLHADLTSGGIFGSKKLQYKIGHWVKDPNPITNEELKGGLFVLNRLSDAEWIVRKRPTSKIFKCKIGKKIRETRYLTKTDKVLLIGEVSNDEMLELWAESSENRRGLVLGMHKGSRKS